MSYTVIQANKEQIEKLYRKHLRFPPIWKRFGYDDEDKIGFVTLSLVTGKVVNYQLRNLTPCFVSFTGFGTIRYDISYPKKEHPQMFEYLKKYGIKASTKFWKGGEI